MPQGQASAGEPLRSTPGIISAYPSVPAPQDLDMSEPPDSGVDSPTQETSAAADRARPHPGPPDKVRRRDALAWLWPLVGLAAIATGSQFGGPAAGVVTGVVCIAIATLVVADLVMRPIGRIAVIAGSLIVVTAVIALNGYGVTWLRPLRDRARPSPAAPASASSPGAARTELVDLRGRVMTQKDVKAWDQFRGAQAAGATFDGLSLSGSNFDDLHAPGASFRGAKLTATTWRGADLRGADFSGACLTGADFTGADLDGVDATGAGVHGVTVDGSALARVRWPGEGSQPPASCP